MLTQQELTDHLREALKHHIGEALTAEERQRIQTQIKEGVQRYLSELPPDFLVPQYHFEDLEDGGVAVVWDDVSTPPFWGALK